MEAYFRFTFLVTHDNGQIYLSTVSYSKKKAKELIIKSENCPASAIEFISKKQINI